MALFSVLSTDILDELNDAGITYYTQTAVTQAMQEAYNIITFITNCIIKKTTLSFQSNLNYYNFTDTVNYAAIYIADFMGPLAVFNNLTNLWLLDDKTLKDFNKDRVDWENWTGAAVWWAPCNDGRRLVFVPKLVVATGSFDFYYYATPPAVNLAQSPLFPSHYHGLIKYWSMFSLLADAQEFKKSMVWWKEFWGISSGDQNYDKAVYGLAALIKNSAKSDLIMLA